MFYGHFITPLNSGNETCVRYAKAVNYLSLLSHRCCFYSPSGRSVSLCLFIYYCLASTTSASSQISNSQRAKLEHNILFAAFPLLPRHFKIMFGKTPNIDYPDIELPFC